MEWRRGPKRVAVEAREHLVLPAEFLLPEVCRPEDEIADPPRRALAAVQQNRRSGRCEGGTDGGLGGRGASVMSGV